MKKLIALLLALTMLFSVATLFAGCEEDSKKKSSSSKNDDDDEDEEEEKNKDGDDENKDEDSDEDNENNSKDDENNEDAKDDEDNKNDEDDKDGDKPADPTEYEFDDTDGNGPLLYKVSDEEGNVIWLLGSIHVGRDDYYPLPDYVMDAFEGSDALAVEADIIAAEEDQTLLLQLAMMTMYTDGSTIADHIPEDVYEQAVEILSELGQYNMMLDYFLPFMWSQTIDSMLIEKTDANSELGIDRYFLNLAKEEGMEILEVESAEFQYSMFAGFSEELQIYLLENSIESYYNTSEYEEVLEKLMDLWQSGNEAEFAGYLAEDSEIDPEYEALEEEYNNAMIVERNESMTEYAMAALESGEEIFICVGAAHVVGEDAIADNLRELGYTVEIVR